VEAPPTTQAPAGPGATAPSPAPASPAPPESLSAIGARVEERLQQLFDHEVGRWSELDVDLAEPLDALRRLVRSGGKRLRPSFCHWGWVAGGGDPADPAIAEVGAAFELLQAFALVHDDVMDDSSTRRGATAIHVAFAEGHRDAGWRGEDRRYGDGVAILVGDLAHVYADHLVGHLEPPAKAVWDELRIELNVGQYLDVLGTARRDTDHGHARRIARYKSGKYTIERPLHLGAAMAGALPRLQAPLSAYGGPMGEAFQLRDDVLGAFGDSSATGKPVGDDLREGKPTVLLAAATRRADAEQRRVLARVGEPGLTPEEIAALQQVLVATGARDEVEGLIAQLTDEALAAVDDAPIPDEAKHELSSLGRYVAARER